VGIDENYMLFKIKNFKGEVEMKKALIVLLLLFFITSTIYSSVVSKTEAEEIAFKWIQIENYSQELRLTKGNIGFYDISELIYKGEKIGYIVQLAITGFMIIPGFSELSPVKFISYSGNYDDLEKHPFIETLKYRLYYTAYKLGYIKTNCLKIAYFINDKIDNKQKNKNESIWIDFLYESPSLLSTLYTSSTAVAPMLTSTWNQHYPYNIYTPVINGQNAPTGCTATAIAQVMYYWKHPSSGQGFYSYYPLGHDQPLSADFNHDYYWSKMFNNYTGSETEEHKDAVARLMSDVGISVETQYREFSSGAVIDDSGLKKFFKYSNDIETIFKHNYGTWGSWFFVFKLQMDNNWPSLLAASLDGGVGHSIVIDGYRVVNDINQIHANMGWSGAHDAYYTMDDIYGYGSELDYAVINIYPPDCNNTGSISGKVTDKSGNYLKNVHVQVIQVKPNRRGYISAWTDINGDYFASCLSPGDYSIYFDPKETGNFAPEWYNDKSSLNTADRLKVTADQTISGINAQLEEGGSIAGWVTDYSGNPVNICGVNLYSLRHRVRMVHGGHSKSDGGYILSNLPSGEYKVYFHPFQCDPNYAAEWYSDKHSLATADIINIIAGQTIPGIDAQLELGGKISGRVTDLNGNGIQGINVQVYGLYGTYTTSFTCLTDINGDFYIARLARGSYKVFFNTLGRNYNTEWYDDKSSYETADIVNLIAGQTTSGINAQLKVIPQFTFTISAGKGGTTDPSPGTYTYGKGTEVTVTAIPDDHYNFDGWSGDINSKNNPITLTMNADKSIKANFMQYDLTINANEGGTTDPSPGTYTYGKGTEVTVTAIPDDHFIFNRWSGDLSGSANPVTIIMDSDKSIKANFRLIYPPLNVSGQKILNQSLLQGEYINVLNWKVNPNNQGINIAKYRIYQMDGNQRNRLVELDAGTFKYWHRKVEQSELYSYELVAVGKDREGKPVNLTIQ